MAEPPPPDPRADNLVVMAHVLARGEAMVVQSALQAAGIPVDIGAARQLGLSPLVVAFGEYRVAVPIGAWVEASAILRSMAAETPVETLLAFRRRVRRLLLAWLGALLALALPSVAIAGSWLAAFYALLMAIGVLTTMTVPPPPWRGDYYLADAPLP